MDWGECSQDAVAPLSRVPPLVTPDPGTRGAACVRGAKAELIWTENTF